MTLMRSSRIPISMSSRRTFSDVAIQTCAFDAATASISAISSMGRNVCRSNAGMMLRCASSLNNIKFEHLIFVLKHGIKEKDIGNASQVHRRVGQLMARVKVADVHAHSGEGGRHELVNLRGPPVHAPMDASFIMYECYLDSAHLCFFDDSIFFVGGE